MLTFCPELVEIIGSDPAEPVLIGHSSELCVCLLLLPGTVQALHRQPWLLADDVPRPCLLFPVMALGDSALSPLVAYLPCTFPDSSTSGLCQNTSLGEREVEQTTAVNFNQFKRLGVARPFYVCITKNSRGWGGGMLGRVYTRNL